MSKCRFTEQQIIGAEGGWNRAGAAGGLREAGQDLPPCQGAVRRVGSERSAPAKASARHSGVIAGKKVGMPAARH